ncbi:hypothetical protein [Streptomyces sp. NPDC003327]
MSHDSGWGYRQDTGWGTVDHPRRDIGWGFDPEWGEIAEPARG